MLALTTAVFLAIAVAWSWIKRLTNIHMGRLPRGPTGLPIIGNLHQLSRQAHVVFTRWAQEYGPVFTVQIGPKTALVVNTHEAAHQALVKHGRTFNHRSPSSLLRIEAKGLGILNNEGPTWSEHRRFTLRCLRNKGFGKGSIEPQIFDEIIELVAELQSHNGESVDPRNILTMSIANILWSVVAGHRFKRGDRQLLELADMNDAIVRTIGNVGLMTFFPQLRYLHRRKFSKLHDAMEKLRNFLYEEMHRHRELNQQKSNFHVDLVDEFLAEAEREKASGEKITFTDEQICAILLDLFVAGVETTVTSLRWALHILLQYPEVQKSIQKEIDEIVGQERMPSNEDRGRMPYTEAALAEVQRFCTVIPVIFHCAAEDTHFMGFDVPRHTPILINNWGIHRNPDDWQDPETFNVNRFLDDKGKFYKSESTMYFGIGKRSCPGESLARMELFLFITCLLQKFDFSLNQGDTLPTKALSGLVMAPEPFRMVFTVRS